MIKGIYRNKDVNDWALIIQKRKNSPIECSIIERDNNHLAVTILSETELKMERSLI